LYFVFLSLSACPCLCSILLFYTFRLCLCSTICSLLNGRILRSSLFFHLFHSVSHCFSLPHF
jgi:hypothetical protein